MEMDQQLPNTTVVIDYFIARFMRVAPGTDARSMLIDFLSNEIGTTNIVEAESYMEDSLRMTFHLLLSLPEYLFS